MVTVHQDILESLIERASQKAEGMGPTVKELSVNIVFLQLVLTPIWSTTFTAYCSPVVGV